MAKCPSLSWSTGPVTVCAHFLLASSQLSCVQGLWSSQASADPTSLQRPPTQSCAPVQNLPSSQSGSTSHCLPAPVSCGGGAASVGPWQVKPMSLTQWCVEGKQQ